MRLFTIGSRFLFQYRPGMDGVDDLLTELPGFIQQTQFGKMTVSMERVNIPPIKRIPNSNKKVFDAKIQSTEEDMEIHGGV